jgi:glutathione peroxidase
MKNIKNQCILASFLLVFSILTNACKKENPSTNNPTAYTTPQTSYSPKEIYHYSYKSIDDGKEIKLSTYRGKKVLFVNTASLCGNTPQYAKLQSLYSNYSNKLVIVGFPCNQFSSQEPSADSSIYTFCTSRYGVTFPLSSKIDVLGSKRDSVYVWLTEKSFNGVATTTVAWNFQKYLIDTNGKYLQMFPNDMQPDDPSIIAAINK